MDFIGRLNSNYGNSFGMFNMDKKRLIVNIICGVLIIVLIIILIICLVNKDKFTDKHDKNTGKPHLVHFKNDKCPFSQKMSKLLADNGNKIAGQQVIDVTMDSPLVSQFNVTGTPTIACTKTKKMSVGYKSLEEIEKELMGNDTGNENGNRHGNGNGNEITNVIVGRPGCPFCTKIYDLLNSNNKNFVKIDSNTDQGKKFMKDLNANGVPLSIRMKNNKIIDHKVGYHEDLSFYN